MEIVLLILKIIGFTLLGILGLALLILLAILFVPVRYKAWGEKHSEISAEGRVTWLLHLLRIKAVYSGGKLHTKGKLLFFNIMSSEEDVEQQLAEEFDDDSLFPDDLPSDEETTSGKEVVTSGDENPTSKEEEIPSGDENPTSKEGEITSGDENPTSKAEEIPSGDENPTSKEEKITSGDENPTSKAEEIPSGDEKTASEKERILSGDENLTPETEEVLREDENLTPETEGEENPPKSLKKKLGNKHKKKDKVPPGEGEQKQGIVKKVKNLYNIKNDPRAKRFYGVAKKKIVKIIRHVLPRKLKGSVRFGTGDPCSTGKILGAAAMIYPLYAGHINVEPVFEEKALEFDLYLRGRVRLFTVLWPALMTYTNRDFKYLRKKVKKAVR